MIEIIYNESGKKDSTVIIKPPKNIRQIGSPRGRHKIYVEDYVYTFLHSAAFEGECQKRAAVLLGKSEISQDIRYTFISGAVSCEDLVFQDDSIVFDESCWEYIYKEIKQYFDNQEIVGWFLGLAGFPLELTPVIEAAHRKYFAGRDKVLFLSEPAEREDVFFAYEQGILQKKEGYYIYYEKNLSMQEYMVCTREKIRELNGGIEAPALQKTETPIFETATADSLRNETLLEHDSTIETAEQELVGQTAAKAIEQGTENQETTSSADQAIQNYRNMLLERKEGPSQKKMSLLLYTAASAAMVILCVIGITTMNNYEKMRQVEQTLATISQSSAREENTDEVQSAGVVVESVPGEVTPEEDQQEAEQQTASQETPDQQAKDQETTEQQTTGQEAEDQQDSGQETDQQDTGDDGQQEATEGADQTQETEATAKTYLEQGYYVVQAGDKLELICKKIYQTTAMMDKLCEVNEIEDVDKIYAGQKLVLP